MGFMRKYNTIFRSIDNMHKLYKLAKKKNQEEKKKKK
jgi:hypothetical protein